MDYKILIVDPGTGQPVPELNPEVARAIAEPPGLWNRVAPIRYRKSVPDSWVELSISEGRNRQVRRMTAAVGLPTLRLIRISVGPWSLDGLEPGENRSIDTRDAWRQLEQ